MGFLAGHAEGLSGELGMGAQLLLNAEDLVVLGEPLGAAGSAGLDLAGGETHDEVCDEAILGLTRPVGDHGSPAVLLGQEVRLDGLSDGADLVDLKEEAVASLLFYGGLDPGGVGDGQIVSYDLDLGAGGHVGPVVPVVLVEGIFDGGDGELLAEVQVHLAQLLSVHLLGSVVVFSLEVKIIDVVALEEFRRSYVHSDLDLAGVASLGDGFRDEKESVLVVEDIRGETTFIPHRGGVQTKLGLDDSFEVVVDLCAHAHGFSEGGGTSGEDHELLHGQLVASVGSTVDDVESRHRQDHVGAASQGGNVFVEGDSELCSTSLAGSERDSENSVGTELVLVGSSVKLEHEVINGSLVGHLEAALDERRSNHLIDILDGIEDALSMVHLLVTVAHLKGFMHASGGAGGHSSPEEALMGSEVNLHGGVSTGVKDGAGEHLGGGHDGLSGCLM